VHGIGTGRGEGGGWGHGLAQSCAGRVAEMAETGRGLGACVYCVQRYVGADEFAVHGRRDWCRRAERHSHMAVEMQSTGTPELRKSPRRTRGDSGLVPRIPGDAEGSPLRRFI